MHSSRLHGQTNNVITTSLPIQGAELIFKVIYPLPKAFSLCGQRLPTNCLPNSCNLKPKSEARWRGWSIRMPRLKTSPAERLPNAYHFPSKGPRNSAGERTLSKHPAGTAEGIDRSDKAEGFCCRKVQEFPAWKADRYFCSVVDFSGSGDDAAQSKRVRCWGCLVRHRQKSDVDTLVVSLIKDKAQVLINSQGGRATTLRTLQRSLYSTKDKTRVIGRKGTLGEISTKRRWRRPQAPDAVPEGPRRSPKVSKGVSKVGLRRSCWFLNKRRSGCN